MYIIKNNAIRILCAVLIVGSIMNILASGLNVISFSTLNSLITIGIVCTFLYFDHKEKAKFNDIFMIDPLTKLPNKYGLENYFISHIKGNSQPYGLITLDIDDFKMINDRYGHKTGDSILINLSKCIKTVSGNDAFICRSYGDEFSVLFPCQNERDATAFAKRLFKEIKAFLNDNSVITLSNLSMGIALYPEHAGNFQDLYKFADHALFYRKHEAGKNGFTLFSNEIFHVAHEEEELAKAFNMAMDNKEIHLNFQPQIHSESMKVVGAEVLTRWNHPEKGCIYPDRFIPIAEKNNLMRKLDFYVFRQACKQLKAWETESFYPITLSVNMSTSTICDRDVALILDRIIKEEKVDPKYLIVEMTEELGLTDFRLTNDILHEISALGIKIALDDFGKGYSSLIYLEKIPINVLKIDKEFITDIDTNRNARMVYKTISDLASKLELKVVSEGIETEVQLNTLMDISHSVMQGYHFSRPLTLENFSAYMKTLDPSKIQTKSA